jgi:hypothetical protein
MASTQVQAHADVSRVAGQAADSAARLGVPLHEMWEGGAMRYVDDSEREDARMERIDDERGYDLAVCVNGHEYDPKPVRATRMEPGYERQDCCPTCGTDESQDG